MRILIREVLTHVFGFLIIFMIAFLIYRINNPYSYPGLENRILFVLVPSVIVLLYLYLEEKKNRNRLFFSVIMVADRLCESKFMSVCEGIWRRSPSFIRTRVSKVQAQLYTWLHKISRYQLKQDPKQVVMYAFLGILLMVTLQSVFPQPLLEWEMTTLMIAAVVLSAVTFYLNRDTLGEIEEEEAQQGEIEEKRREMEFAGRYPRINQVGGVRWVVRWMYKEGWWYSIGLVLLVFIAFSIRVYNLTILYPYTDEYNHLIAAKSLQETGTTDYTRA
ncbi:MAG: hypothetical protein M8353_06520, partial [ANME-2 cluster archaeon]|nr:hypothetical protein [ANME-2 cluster archaeon]